MKVKFRTQQNKQENELISELEKSALAASNSGNYVAATTIWLLVSRKKSDRKTLVQLMECARLSGSLFAMPDFKKLTCMDIVKTLGSNYSIYLLRELAKRRKISNIEVNFLRSTYGDIPWEVDSQILKVKINVKTSQDNSDKNSLKEIKCNSIWDWVENKNTEIISESYWAKVPEIKILNPINITQPKLNYEIRGGAVIELKNVKSWISSDLMVVDGNPTVDFYSWEGSNLNIPYSDSRVSSVENFNLQLKQELKTKNYVFDQAIWLAYPHTSSWGHWVRDILTRLVYLNEVLSIKDIPIIIDEKVPLKFQNFAQMLFPGINFYALKYGSAVEVTKMWISPSRVFAIHNSAWSLHGMESRLNAEPDSFARLKKIARNFCNDNSVNFEIGDKVFLDRSQGMQNRELHKIKNLYKLMEKNRIPVIDPGDLTNIEQLKLFTDKKSLVGLDGSQWFLGGFLPHGSSATIIGHDLATDSRGRSWTIESATGKSPQWFLGLRDLPLPGYGESIYHQSFSLDAVSWKILEEHLAENFFK